MAVDLKRNLLPLAVIFSLAIHLAAFSIWQLGQSRNWWTVSHIPRWFQKALSSILPVAKIPPTLFPAATPPSEPPLIYVRVENSDEKAPPDTRFYGAANTLASNPDKKIDSNLPQIDGQQDKVIRTEDKARSDAKPLQPSPPKTNPSKESDMQPAEKARPRESQPVGDLAFVKPHDLLRPPANQKESDTGTAAKTAHERPRKLSDVKSNPAVRSEKMKQAGGVNRLAVDSAFDVKGSPLGDYDRQFIDAVQQRWDYLCAQIQTFHEGKVVLEFRLHYDGRISEMKMNENSTASDLLAVICRQAILDPSPYSKWPIEMRREVGKDFRDVTFTFFYNTY